jgi:reverse gyrase
MHIRRTFPNHYGTKVTSIVLRILRGEDIPKEIKYTFIVLIPKVESPSKLGQFDLLANSMFFTKIASKVPANRLEKILPEIIS